MKGIICFKDLGYEYIQQGLDKNAMGAKITHSFYDVPIWHIDIIENNYFTTMLNKQIENETYALSFELFWWNIVVNTTIFANDTAATNFKWHRRGKKRH